MQIDRNIGELWVLSFYLWKNSDFVEEERARKIWSHLPLDKNGIYIYKIHGKFTNQKKKNVTLVKKIKNKQHLFFHLYHPSDKNS